MVLHLLLGVKPGVVLGVETGVLQGVKAGAVLGAELAALTHLFYTFSVPAPVSPQWPLTANPG